MNDDFDNEYAQPSDEEAAEDAARARESFERIRRFAVWCVIIAVIASAFVASWRVTCGLALGGGLSLLNHRWLSASVRQMFAKAEAKGVRVRVRISAYVWRWFFVGAVIWLAYALNLISLTATLAGLCSFIVAGFLEALWQLYLTFIHKKES